MKGFNKGVNFHTSASPSFGGAAPKADTIKVAGYTRARPVAKQAIKPIGAPLAMAHGGLAGLKAPINAAAAKVVPGVGMAKQAIRPAPQGLSGLKVK